MILHNFINISHADDNDPDYIIDTSADVLSDQDWDKLNSNPATIFANPKIRGIPLQMNNKTGKLISHLSADDTVIADETWDIVQLSEKNTLQVMHTLIGDHFTNYAVITPGLENEFDSIEWESFVDSNGNSRSLLQMMPELSNIGEVYAWVSHPELYQVPENVIYLTLASFIDALEVRHASAHTPSLNLVQMRDLNADPNWIQTVGITWHHRGLNQVLRPITRCLLGSQTIGRQTWQFNIDTNKLEPSVIMGGIGAIVADRPGRSEVSMVTGIKGVNNIPKFVGYHEQKFPLQYWRNKGGLLSADMFKSQGMINGLINLVHRFRDDPRMTENLKLQLARAVGM